MMMICTVIFEGRPRTMCRPELICMTPSPREVTIPATVANTARMSTSVPSQPSALSSPISGINVVLIIPFFFFRNPKYARASPMTE